jgi:hypothetical protein
MLVRADPLEHPKTVLRDFNKPDPLPSARVHADVCSGVNVMVLAHRPVC